MIRHIKGEVTQVTPTYVVIDVQGVGYKVFTTPKTSVLETEIILLHTHLAVRENAMDLYGFLTQEELSFFELLLTLPKIGPKSALQILSQAEVSLLQSAILSQDATHLSKMSGISKKTAEKVVAGLKDVFENMGYAALDHQAMQSGNQGNTSDAIDALITLGYPQSDARKVIQHIVTNKPELAEVHQVIKEALKLMSGKLS